MPDSNKNRNFDFIILKHELQYIIQGNGSERANSLIQTIATFIRASKTASAGTQKNKYTKEQETTSLIAYINEQKLWYVNPIDEDHKIGEGAEQKVYYSPAMGTVIKLNDSIYFAYWEDYFHNLLLHNYFFPAVSYVLLGFVFKKETLYAVVEQPFVIATNVIDLNNVKEFLKQNGFENTKNNDYYHNALGIILEDLHDENVISSGDALHFIDTVFYLTPQFYK